GAAPVRQAIHSLGGAVIGELPMIGAVAAHLPAVAVAALGRARGVAWVSLDAPMLSSVCTACVDTSRLKSAFITTIGADRVWNQSPKYLQGQGIGVAIVDSGINPQDDFYTIMGRNRLVAAINYNEGYNQHVYDVYGHGNHVAGLIGGRGARSNGAYIGVAPGVDLINVKVTDDQGAATMSNVIRGLQWIYDNRARYNIRVVNVSMNSSVAESYHVNPLDAALEVLWFSGVVVVASAGNNATSGVLYPPANDPFVITVGATNDKGTPDVGDDSLAPFSAYGVTAEGIAKPDLVAPGTNLVSLMSAGNTELARKYPNNVVETWYFRMSGTSMAAPVVAGAVALLLQDEPNLTPHQVKYRLMATARRFDTPGRAGAGYLDVAAAVNGTTTETANNGVAISKLAWQWAGGTASSWSSVNWASVNWASVNWASVNWASVNWASDHWAN
ncbi:MAG TPA: S8 family peptidase, partial [Roseiflexaceae bacterium]|nr:S8 family peptidase [Roseiflexaceae bacterium]